MIQNLLSLQAPAIRADLLREADFDVLRRQFIVSRIDAGEPVKFAPEDKSYSRNCFAKRLSMTRHSLRSLPKPEWICVYNQLLPMS